MANRIPRPGGEMPTYLVGKPKKTYKKPSNPVGFKDYTGTPGTNNYVQRSFRENIGEPSSSKYVQRSPKENIGEPSSSKYVQRDFTSGNTTPRKRPR
jgi:hypothetical protein